MQQTYYTKKLLYKYIKNHELFLHLNVFNIT